MNEKYLKRTIKREILSSNHLTEKKEIQIYLPPDFTEENNYPLLLLHDGPDYLNLGRIATQTNQLLAENKIEPFIIALIPVDKSKRTSEYSPMGSRNEHHKAFVVEELIPMLTSKYPVNISTETLVIGGSSLGGTVSLHLALEYPELFNRVLSQSGAFLEKTKEEISNVYSLSFLDIYQSIGLSETAIQTHMGTLDLVARNREVHQILVQKQAHVSYFEEEGDHTWGFWQRELPRALVHFFGIDS